MEQFVLHQKYYEVSSCNMCKKIMCNEEANKTACRCSALKLWIVSLLFSLTIKPKNDISLTSDVHKPRTGKINDFTSRNVLFTMARVEQSRILCVCLWQYIR